jgi:hypothetical protein
MEEDDIVKPSTEYLAKVAVPSQILPLDPSRRQLLILDLNGTLVSRTKNRGSKFYVRPHCHSFFDYIFANFTVMVWSSATEPSVERMCKIFDPQKHPLFLKWHRKHFNLTQEDFYSNRETLKDLDLVWCQLPEFDATNTIIIDDTKRKVARQPHNLVQVSTFHHDLVLNREKRDQDLCKVTNYLRILKLQSNVSNFICNNPFDLRMDWGILPNDTLDFMTTASTKKGKVLATEYPTTSPPQPTVLPPTRKRRASFSNEDPDYIPLEPLIEEDPDYIPSKPKRKKEKKSKRKMKRESDQQDVCPLPQRFSSLRTTVGSPSPPSSSKKVQQEQKANIKPIKSEKMDNPGGMLRLENGKTIQFKPEKPPLRLSTHAALVVIQKNIKQRKRAKKK